MESTPRVTIDSRGDVAKSQELVEFSLNQRRITKDLMKFNDLKQGKRVINMSDGSVITVQSCYGQDEIYISSPKLGGKTQVILLKTEKLELRYLVIDESFLVHWFKCKVVKDEDGKEVVEVNEEKVISINTDDPEFDGLKEYGMFEFYKADFSCGGEDTNSVYVRVYAEKQHETWEILDWSYSVDRLPVLVTTVKNVGAIEVEKYVHSYSMFDWDGSSSTLDPDPGYRIPQRYAPKEEYISSNGMNIVVEMFGNAYAVLFTEVCNNEWTGYNKVYRYYISQYNTQYPFPSEITENNLKRVAVTTPSSHNGNYVFAVAIFNFAYWFPPHGDPEVPGYWDRSNILWEGVFIDAYILSVPESHFVEGSTSVWMTDYENISGGVLGASTRIVSLTKDEFYQLSQIECFDNKMYVFSCSARGFRAGVGPYVYSSEPADPTWDDLTQAGKLDVYDFSGNLLMSHSFSSDFLDRATIVKYPIEDKVKETPFTWAICIREQATDAGGYSPLIVLNAFTLAQITSVSLISGPTVAVNSYKFGIDSITVDPTRDYIKEDLMDRGHFLNKINLYRKANSLGYVGYSKVLEELAKEHLVWCVENCMLTYAGVDGKSQAQRSIEKGVYNSACFTALINSTTAENEIDKIMGAISSGTSTNDGLHTEYATSFGYYAVNTPIHCINIEMDDSTVNVEGQGFIMYFILFAMS